MGTDEEKEPKPRVLAPVVPPTVAPTVQPTVPPTVRPTVAPVMQPVKPPVVRPVAAPVVQPVASPVARPVKAPPPAPAPVPVPVPLEPAASAPAPGTSSTVHHRAADRVAGHTGIPTAYVAAFAVFLLSAIGALVAWTLAKDAAANAMDTVDAAGRAASRALASLEFDWWLPKHGTAEELRKRAEEALGLEEISIRAMADGPAKEELKAELDLARNKLVRTLFANRKNVDDLQEARNRERFVKLAFQESLVGVDLFDPNTKAPMGIGRCPSGGTAFEKVGDGFEAGFRVQSPQGGPAVSGRLYLSPVRGKDISESGQIRIAGYAGVALSTGPAQAMVDEAARKGLIAGGAVLGFGFVAALVVGILFAPLRRVLRDAEEFSRGNFEHRPSPASGGEIGAVGRAVSRMALAARDREAEALAKAAAAVPPPVDHRPLVSAALAPGALLRVPGWEIEGTSRACFEIAGDFFDYSPAVGGRISCILVESSLRGLPAAFLSGEIRGLYRGMAPHHDSASVLLDSLGAVVGPHVPEGEEVHATVMVADPQTGAAGIARAGKANPPIVLRAETRALEKIEVDGPPVRRTGGAGTGGAAGHVEIALQPRDRLAFVSDGLFRARNSKKEKFGEQRLDGLVLKFGPMNSTAFVNMVVNDVDLFHEGAAQRDDLTVLTVRRLR